MSSLTYGQLLRTSRPFRYLWSGQVISELGNWFNFIAGLGLVRAVASAAPGATAAMLVARLVPFAFFAPIAGAFVDRWSRRTVMIVSDLARAVVALGFLLVDGPEDLWIAYTCAVIATLLAAFFEAAKNAVLPNITGSRGLLAGNALMFSTRFLLMSFGAALGGWTSARFGYKAAFIINAVSFVVSAYSIWRIPEADMRESESVEGSAIAEPESRQRGGKARSRLSSDLGEAWTYIGRYPLIAALMGLNVLWATGGGACNLIYDRLGGLTFAGTSGLAGDAGVAVLYAAVGAGLFFGILLARRIGAHVELHGVTASFIGWMLFAHGVLFALAGLMPNLWLTGLLFFMSRFVIGMEFTVQETLLLRLVPDRLRGRIVTTDRAAEIFVTSISTIFAAWSLNVISPRTLTIVSGLLSGVPGLIWLVLFSSGRLKLPAKLESDSEARPEEEQGLLVSAS